MGLFERMMEAADQLIGEISPAGSGSAGNGSPNDGGASTANSRPTVSPREKELARNLAQAANEGVELVRYALLFSGDVQGVGFRWTNQGLANEHGLTGWARNLADGTVEMELQGTPAAVSEHLARIHAYYQRFHNRIWLEQANRLDTHSKESTFSVRY